MLTPAEVQAVVQSKLGGIRACFELASRRHHVKGTLVRIAWTIQPDGSVTDARVAENTAKDTDLARCVWHRILDCRVRASCGATHTSYPFVFIGSETPP